MVTLRSKVATIINMINLDKLYSGFIITFVLICLTASRLPEIFNITGFPQISTLRYAGGLLAAFMLLRSSPRTLFYYVLTGFLLYFHAITNHFAPSLSLSMDVPILDYILAPGVSAKWSLGVAKSYLEHTLLNALILTPILFLNRKKSQRLLKQIACVVLFSILMNVTFIAVQKFWDKSFFTAGSGTALSASRLPGLLEDSGASSIFLLLALSITLQTSISLTKLFPKALFGILSLGIFYLGLVSQGRIFIAGSIILSTLLILFNLRQLFAKQSFKSVLIGAILLGTVGTLSFTYQASRDTRRVSHTFNKIEKLGFNLNALKSIDNTRFIHSLAMLDAYKERPIRGHGLGAFHAINKHYEKKMKVSSAVDWPTSFYFQMLSELGLAGALILICIFASYTYLLFLYIKSKKPTLTHSLAISGLTASLISLTVGIHYVFDSISILFAIFAISSFYLLEEMSPKFLIFLRGAATGLIILLLTLSVANVNDANSEIPIFKWDKTGHAQVPNNLKETIDNKKGRWVRSGEIVLLKSTTAAIFIKHPEAFYPLKISIDLGVKGSNFQMSEIIKATGPSWHEVKIDQKYESTCLKPTMERYCFMKFDVAEWQWEDHKLGVFMTESSPQKG